MQKLSSHVGSLTQENTDLRHQIQQQLLQVKDERAKFAEGAVWMGRYAANTVERFGEKVYAARLVRIALILVVVLHRLPLSPLPCGTQSDTFLWVKCSSS